MVKKNWNIIGKENMEKVEELLYHRSKIMTHGMILKDIKKRIGTVDKTRF